MAQAVERTAAAQREIRFIRHRAPTDLCRHSAISLRIFRCLSLRRLLLDELELLDVVSESLLLIGEDVTLGALKANDSFFMAEIRVFAVVGSSRRVEDAMFELYP